MMMNSKLLGVVQAGSPAYSFKCI